MGRLTNQEKQELRKNIKLWPKCKYCGKRIHPDSRKRKDGTMSWTNWLNALYCNSSHKFKAEAAHRRFKRKTKRSKTCAVCGKRFKQTTETKKQWLSRTLCDEHLQKRSKNLEREINGAYKPDDSAKGKAIKTGFYVFHMSAPDEHKRKGKLNHVYWC